jgi:transcriptional regulator with GAF, ATPase, and Fis domain
MVAINCSALPENLLEAELFGHTKGAFTGAIGARVGRFEQAHKSTLFLDEIGDMPLELQAKLLRVLQDREVQRLGSSENIKIDVRVIAASNVDLLERVRQGKFRQDLYYRLNVFPLGMPPLRKRVSDIPALVSHFIVKICHAEDIPLKRVTPEALEQLSANPWPGNVRQLENSVEMAIAVSGDRDVLYTKDFGLVESRRASGPISALAPIPGHLPEAVDFDTAVSRFELAMLENALRASDGNKTAAAERLGIKRTTLIMKIRNFENSGLSLQKAG